MTHGTTRSTARAFGASLVLAAALLTTACGTTQPGAAATVGDRVISEAELTTAVEELNAAGVSQDKLTPAIVLPYLIMEPSVVDFTTSQGGGDPMDAARQFLRTKGLADPADSTVRVMSSATIVQEVMGAGGAAADELASVIAKSKVSVNPRYGSFDATNPLRLVNSLPAWIVAPSP